MTTPLKVTAPLELHPESPLARISAKCADCKGCGIQIVERPSDMYSCGFATFAETCVTCLGFGRVVDLPVDNKVAAGGAQ